MIFSRYIILCSLLGVLLFIFSNSTVSQTKQDYMFDLITSENNILQKGLSQNTVYSILQDQYGYMWFGTWDGLNKYDGYNFTIFNKQQGLSNETINCLLEDETGKIWIGTEDGLNCYDRKAGLFTIFRHDANDSTTLSDNWINYLFQDRPDKIYICTPKGLNVMNIQTGTVRRYQSRDAGFRRTRSNWINCILQSEKGIYWVGTRFGLVKYNSQTHENVRFLNRPDDPSSLSSNIVTRVYKDSEGLIWIGTSNGLNFFDPEEGSFQVFKYDPMDDNSLSNNSISDIFEDSYGNLWIGTDGGGVNILNRGNFTFNRIQNEPNNAQSLSNNRIYDIYQDHTGTMWFGTFKGVSKFDSFSNKFALFTHNPDNKNSVSDNFIWSFVEAEPNVFWIGTNNGISIYYKNDNRFEHLDYDPGKSNWLSSRRIRPILQDRNGNFWLGTRDAGLDWLDAKTGRIKNFSPYDQIGKSICDPYVQILAQDSTGLVWVGTANGLNTIDPESHKIEVYKHVPGDSTSIPNDIIFFIFEDSDRILWIATQNGLCYYNRDVDNFTTYKSPRNKDGEITSNKFFYLMEDSNNNLWVGTRGGGLAKLDKKDNSFIAYTTEDGLPNDVIYGILEDNDGHFWMSTNWGISKFNITSKTFLNYDVTDGLQSNEFNANACIKSKEGEMYFGGMKGFNSFFPSDIKVNTNIPKIVITGFKKFNEIQPLEIHNEDTIILEHNDNFFSFEFSALDYTNPSKNQYAYFLEEYNKDWTHIDGRKHSAEYTNVGPGKYIFRVIGSNNNNIWNYEGTSLTLIIQPPWYQTWLFRITGILFIISAIWAFVFYRLRRIRRKHEIEKRVLFIEKELFEIQQKALRLQMNPHFIFNSLNSIQSFILSNDIDLAVNYLSKFSQLMRLILANSRESIVPLSDEIQAITHYLEIEKLRFEDKFNYRVIVDSQIDDEFIGIPPMIIQPYIENAIIHGLVNKPMPGKIIIEFLKKESTLRCSISDDGIGRERAMEIKKKSGLSTKSRGMMITQERLEILNRGTDSKFSVKVTDLFDKNNKPSGTRVDLVILFKEL